MKRIIRILFLFIIFCQNELLLGKSFYKIVIDPGHSYKEAEEGAKIGPRFKVNNKWIYGFKIGEGKDIKYEFGETVAAVENKTKEKGWEQVGKNVGFIEAALNLEVAKELKNLLNKARNSKGQKIFEAIITKNDHREMKLKERAQVVIKNKADLFLSIHFNGTSKVKYTTADDYLSIYYFKNKYKVNWWKKFYKKYKNTGNPGVAKKADKYNEVPITFTGAVFEVIPERENIGSQKDGLTVWGSKNTHYERL